MFLNSVKEINRLRKETNRLLSNVFTSIKEINRLRKEINRNVKGMRIGTSNKGMSNIYLKVTIETFSKLRFSGFKKFVTRSVFGELQLMEISLQNCVWLFYYFNFERNYGLLKLKSPCILLNKN